MKVDLPEELCLIIPHFSGFLFEDIQTGGYACHHHTVEGSYIVIPSSVETEKIALWFTGSKYNGWCSEGIDGEDADFIDSMLQLCLPGLDYKVSRGVQGAGLLSSEEAWIELVSPLMDTAYLTWPNSD